MQLKFQLEPYSAVVDELKVLLPLHWKEVALHQDKIALDPDYAIYEQAAKEGKLVIVTGRDSEGKLGAYHAAIICPHLHHRQVKLALTDVYFMLARYRNAGNGIRFFRFYERSMKELGVGLLMTTTKVYLNKGSLFELLGWQESERVYSKYIGD